MRQWNFDDIISHAITSKSTQPGVMSQINHPESGEVFFVFFTPAVSDFAGQIFDAFSVGVVSNPDQNQAERLDIDFDVNMDNADSENLWDEE